MCKVYFDMDGVIAEWNSQATPEEVASKGYFLGRKLVKQVKEAMLILKGIGLDIHILSSVYSDDHSAQDKMAWLKINLPEISEDKIHFCEYGKEKGSALEKVEHDDLLIDDYTPNLRSWKGKAIKMYNGINGTGRNGGWNGYSVHLDMGSEFMAMNILAIANMDECLLALNR